MTIILTVISRHGIVQASDSFVTGDGKERVSADNDKVFALGFCAGAVAWSGTYRVGLSERVSDWLPERIDEYQTIENPTIGGFASFLCDRLNVELTDDQRLMYANLIHVAGYESDGDGVHPVLYFVRNASGIDQVTGKYTGTYDDMYNCTVTEDFWSRDLGTRISPADFASGRTWMRYFNGAADGRIALVQFHQTFEHFVEAVQNNPGSKFRKAESLEEMAVFAELEIRTLCAMYKVSDYELPVIGGEPQVLCIPAPNDVSPFTS